MLVQNNGNDISASVLHVLDVAFLNVGPVFRSLIIDGLRDYAYDWAMRRLQFRRRLVQVKVDCADRDRDSSEAYNDGRHHDLI